MRAFLKTTIAALALALSGCATTRPTAAAAEVSAVLEERAGIDDAVAAEARSHAEVRARVETLLAEPLTLEAALRIAVINNRGLLATMEELGVAQSDLVQAGLLQNPTIGGDLLISTRGNGLGGGVSLSQSLLSVFLIPAKRRVAKAALQRTILTVGGEALTLVRDVKVAYAELAAAVTVARLQRERVQAAEVADELATRQREAGNISPLQRAEVAAALDEARMTLLERELEVVSAREQINRLMGLWGDDTRWTMAAASPEMPADGDLSALEQHGIRERLDVSAARFHVDAVDYALALRRRGIVPNIDVGVEGRNEVGDDIGHEWVVGPSLQVELPLFDPGHADLAKLRAQLRQAQHLYQHAAIVARSQMREGRAALVAARRRVDYMRTAVLPRHEQIYEQTLREYNGMLVGAYELFSTRSEQVHAQQEYAEALRDYWIARAQLEYWVGGRLPSAARTR